jgi:GntR family transcriptional regulator
MAHTRHRVFGSQPIPRYVQLADFIRQRIVKGHWPPGTALPSLEQLMAEFSVSRVTVREAIAMLAEEGLLSPQRGRGTFVTSKGGCRHQLRVETTLDEILAIYRDDRPEHATLTEGLANPVLLEKDGVPAPKYFHMRRVHSRGGERYCVISMYIDHRVFRRAPTRFRRELVLPVLMSLRGLTIAQAQQTLTISTADLEVANLLGIAVNTPMAEVRRVLCGPDNLVIYLAEISYRGDFIRLEMDLKSRPPAALA